MTSVTGLDGDVTRYELLYGYDLNGMLTRETRRENGADSVSEYADDALNRIDQVHLLAMEEQLIC